MNDSADRTDELARAHFQSRTLYELLCELDRAEDASELARIFLPFAMGSLGVISGFVVLRGLDENACDVEFRGLQGDDARLREGCIELLDKIFPPGETKKTDDILPVVLHGAHLTREFLLPPGTCLLLGMIIARDIRAVVGFGPRLTSDQYGDEELWLLQSMARHFALALRRGHDARRIRALNENLSRQNVELEKSLSAMEMARNMADHQAFLLGSLFQAAKDMSACVDAESLGAAFLLHAMGAESSPGGFVAVFDEHAGSEHLTTRGLSPSDAEFLSSPEGRKLLLGLFVAQKDRLPRHMESQTVDDPSLLERLPGPPSQVLLFALDAECRGVMALLPRLSPGAPGEGDRNLLSSMTATFLSALGRTRAHEDLARLNRDLEVTNAELRATIEALRSARVEIGLLAEARDRILDLARRGFSRAGRIAPADFVLIFLVSISLAVLFNISNPAGIALAPRPLLAPAPATITAQETAALLASGEAVLLDARPPEFFNERRITGALNAPAGLFDFVYAMRLADIDPDSPIVIYGRTVSMLYDAEVALKLGDLGHDAVYVLAGDFDDWNAAGLAVEENP